MAPVFHALTVASVRPEGEDAVCLTFDLPAALRPGFAFTPGQYVTLRARVGGADLRRPYSICSVPGEAQLSVGIRRVQGGRFSGFAAGLRPGDRVQVMEPEGRFGIVPGGRHRYLTIAAGSGITPVLAILRAVLEGEPESEAMLLYGNRTTASIMFREALDDLKDRHLGRFALLHVLSRESQEVDLLDGRIDAAKLRLIASRGLLDPAGLDAAFLCGPQAMADEAAATLAALGLAPERVRRELFTPAEDAAPALARPPVPGAVLPVAVEVVLDGTRRSFRMDPGRTTVLQAAHEAGIELPFSCAGGMCCTCRARVAEGAVAMDRNFSLEPWELAAGYVLTCQSRPTGARLVLDFDAV